jgi:hypothetical protein
MVKLGVPCCNGDAEHKIRHLNEFVEEMKMRRALGEMDLEAEAHCFGLFRQALTNTSQSS